MITNGTRFIPAYAGNSEKRYSCQVGSAVHPRLRGELSLASDGSPIGGGSSPLTRGTRRNITSQFPTSRFIPAYAGNSYIYRVLSKSFLVHPRLRGELLPEMKESFGNFGSSPLTRGTLWLKRSGIDCCRFIPAYAGNSLKMVTTLHLSLIHI